MTRAIRAWPWFAAAAAGALVLLLHRDYGATWDEDVQDRYGGLVRDYFRSFGHDRRFQTFEDLRYYGGPVELALVLLRAGDERSRFDNRHLWLGLFAVLAIPALARYTRELWKRPSVGACSVLVLATMPGFVGHIYNNSKDVPFAIAVAFYMACLWSTFAAPRLSYRTALAFALSLGLLLGVRPGGLLVAAGYAVLAAALAYALDLGWMRTRNKRAARRDGALKLAGATLLAYGLMLLCWPWAQADPLFRPWLALGHTLAFPRVYTVLFEGAMHPSNALPRRYLLEYLVIASPPSTLLLAIAGMFFELRRRRERSATQAFGAWLTLAWLAMPILAFAILRPNAYDGLRHFLFVLPALAIFAGLGVIGIVERMRATRARNLAWPLAVGILLAPLPELFALHPYESSYFNSAVGGLHGANGRYEVDYWASSLREAVRWLNRHASQHSGNARTEVLLGVASLYPKAAAEYYATPGLHIVAFPELQRLHATSAPFDYYIAPARDGMSSLFPAAPTLFAVTRDGVQLAVVKRLDGLRIARKP